MTPSIGFRAFRVLDHFQGGFRVNMRICGVVWDIIWNPRQIIAMIAKTCSL
jgi:hypothetical protein